MNAINPRRNNNDGKYNREDDVDKKYVLRIKYVVVIGFFFYIEKSFS